MRILIVEDELRLVELLKSTFTMSGYAVDYLTDGAEAERRIEASHKDYDLIILDWVLPNRDGLQISKYVRSKGITVPILMLTARFDMKDKIMALDAGVDDYMVKPFALEELEARVRALLRRPKKNLDTIFVAGPLKLDNAAHKVMIDTRVIRLTVKEFAILEYLLRNIGKVLSRQDIVDHVWDFDFNSFSNVIDVHMKNLRRKLKYKNRSFIETIRGVGYRIKEY